MFNPAITNKLTSHFPEVKLLTKDKSFLMKLLGLILFFNPTFMTKYITTIGYNIYFPSEEWVKTRQISAFVTLLHELTHVSDAKKLTRPLFSFLYLTPLALVLPALLLFLLSWKVALVAAIICLAPIPSYFRMLFEKRAYFVSMYVEYNLNAHKGFNIDLVASKDSKVSQFTGSAYYFMWPFSNIKTEFNEALAKIQLGQRPYESPMFDIIDDFLTAL